MPLPLLQAESVVQVPHRILDKIYPAVVLQGENIYELGARAVAKAIVQGKKDK